MTLATGIVLHAQTPEDILSDAENGIMACETPTDSINGTIYAGVIRPESFREIRTGHGHLLGISPSLDTFIRLYISTGRLTSSERRFLKNAAAVSDKKPFFKSFFKSFFPTTLTTPPRCD